MNSELKRRRHFLQTGLSIAGGTMLGLVIQENTSTEELETVRLIYPDGRVVTVERQHISGVSGVLSDDELDKWKTTRKQ